MIHGFMVDWVVGTTISPPRLIGNGYPHRLDIPLEI